MKWFDMTIKINPDLLDSYHGYGLCHFKRGDPESAITYLDLAIEKLNDEEIKNRKMFTKFYFRYLRALCHKQLHNFRESQRDYQSINKTFELQEGLRFSKHIFAMVMVPLEANRKKQLKYVEYFNEILKRYDDENDKLLLAPHYIAFGNTDRNVMHIRENTNPKWLDKKMPEVLKTLMQKYFFKRFKLPRIREMMDKLDLVLMEKKEILFFETDKVYVILSGTIIMKNHEKRSELPETLAKFGEGDILNFLQGKSKIFNSIETWFMAQSRCEIAVFDKAYF